MLSGIIVKIVVFLLRSTSLNFVRRTELLNATLEKLAALPIRDIIQFNEDGSIFVNGKQLSKDQVISLRESARASLNSFAERTIEDQVLFKALSFGTNTATSLEQLFFSKAAVWWGQERHKILKTLTSVGTEGQEPTL